MQDIETIIRDLKIVEEQFGDPNTNSGYALFAGKTAESALAYLMTIKAVEPIQEGHHMGFRCGSCTVRINRDDKYCHECGVKIKWNKNIRDFR